MAKNDKEKVTVAKGRTVHAPDKVYGPGETLTLPADEAAELRKHGFLIALPAETESSSDDSGGKA